MNPPTDEELTKWETGLRGKKGYSGPSYPGTSDLLALIQEVRSWKATAWKMNKALHDLKTERDRYKAVADAAKALRGGVYALDDDGYALFQRRRDGLSDALAALDQQGAV